MTPLQSFVGIPWRVGGRGFDGLDCVGLALLAQRELWGREYPFPWDYNPERDVALETVMYDWLPTISTPCADPVVVGIVVIELTVSGMRYKHLATVVDDNMMLHIYPQHRSRMSRLKSYLHRICGCFEAKEVSECPAQR